VDNNTTALFYIQKNIPVTDFDAEYKVSKAWTHSIKRHLALCMGIQVSAHYLWAWRIKKFQIDIFYKKAFSHYLSSPFLILQLETKPPPPPNTKTYRCFLKTF